METMTECNLDQIHIKNLEVFANHGVFPEENKLGQKFLIDAILYLYTREAGLKDDLTKSVHYGEVSHFITEFLREHTFQLIETAVEQTAQAVLLKFSRIEQITLEISKPWAPIGLPLECVSVKIKRGWHKAFVAIGSNLGEKEDYIKQGIKELSEEKECVVVQVSSIITTKPYGVTEQPDFLNGVVELKTLFSPQELLEKLQQIEFHANRERKIHWGPRTLDLDIIFYDNLILDTTTLHIPHVDMQNRTFVLKPLAELAPYLRHPYLGKTVEQLCMELED